MHLHISQKGRRGVCPLCLILLAPLKAEAQLAFKPNKQVHKIKISYLPVGCLKKPFNLQRTEERKHISQQQLGLPAPVLCPATNELLYSQPMLLFPREADSTFTGTLGVKNQWSQFHFRPSFIWLSSSGLHMCYKHWSIMLLTGFFYF